MVSRSVPKFLYYVLVQKKFPLTAMDEQKERNKGLQVSLRNQQGKYRVTHFACYKNKNNIMIIENWIRTSQQKKQYLLHDF